MAVKLEKGGVLSSLSLTPLIDVVFLLLIFFLVASRFEEEERSVDLNLPTASEATALTDKPDRVIVNITKDLRYVVQSKTYPPDALQALLTQRSQAAGPGRVSVLIRADEEVKIQPFLNVVDMCKKAQITSYDVAVDK